MTKPPVPTSPVPAAVRLLAELEDVMDAMTVEHQRLAGHIDALTAAMRRLDVKAMDAARRSQEGSRGRLASMDTRRRAAVRQLARLHGLPGEPKVPQLADLYPARRAALLVSRRALRDAVADANGRGRVAGRLARSVLGHLNAAVRAFARAVDRPGTYTRDGTPRLNGGGRRLGTIERVA